MPGPPRRGARPVECGPARCGCERNGTFGWASAAVSECSALLPMARDWHVRPSPELAAAAAARRRLGSAVRTRGWSARRPGAGGGHAWGGPRTAQRSGRAWGAGGCKRGPRQPTFQPASSQRRATTGDLCKPAGATRTTAPRGPPMTAPGPRRPAPRDRRRPSQVRVRPPGPWTRPPTGKGNPAMASVLSRRAGGGRHHVLGRPRAAAPASAPPYRP